VISVERDGPDRGKEYDPAITCRGVDPALFPRSERPIGEHQPRIRLPGAQRELQLGRHQTSPAAIDTATASSFCCSVYHCGWITISVLDGCRQWHEALAGVRVLEDDQLGASLATMTPRSKARDTARGQVGYERRRGIHALSCCISFIYYKYYC
jgi:hypothetical protein